MIVSARGDSTSRQPGPTVVGRNSVRNLVCRIWLTVVLLSFSAIAGDDASGPVQYQVDLSRPFDSYELTDQDRAWAETLVMRLGYSGKVVYFVRTNLPLQVNGSIERDRIYVSSEMPEYFYVSAGDAMLRIGAQWPYSPGTGGFSMHAPPSRRFIVCLNCKSPGVPFLSSSPVIRGVVSWGGHDDHRI